MDHSFSSDHNAASSSSDTGARSQIGVLEKTTIMTDSYSLLDVLAKLKDQVRLMALRVSKLDQYVNFVKNPVHSVEPQEMLKLKQNVINGLTHLVENTKPLSYPCYQSLSSVKLLETFEKVSSECVLLLNDIKQDNENIIKSTDRLNNLSIQMKDFQQEIEKIINENVISTEIEEAVALEFKECRSDMVRGYVFN
ncbi:Hypothetical protein CINCED_3A019041 [Cinara cedri]|uniref:Uncharacterized protein n=1 Tax=Cinara cedri TaxID=506608 RepID=A0A5E4MYF6_9HEMI|nr:Hypothetical protein CINCED_3A019041 [Cinara cedri]